ncbi:MAG: class SAM-dependent methyltransferase [Crocinitomicaceae bacterium]|jgi:SAM-dependent methyltransferase|nr:class SAM-dependent methyltransferase [Crocinitomicaceae bacterium]
MKGYNRIKKMALRLVPKSFLIRNEAFFRSMLSVFYRGTNFQCNICEARLKSFVENENRSCPMCGSIARERRLWEILNRDYLQQATSILDFSPSRATYRKLKARFGNQYTGTDLSGDFLSDQAYDITKIECAAESFDLILCYHILEHIEDDRQAMHELYRILQKNGTCLIQTPFKEGEIYEDYTIRKPEERLLAFGQDDHVRVYSLNGLKSRLEESGFTCEVLHFEENSPQESYNGLKEEEYILICKK